jgi:BolA protein
MKERIVKKLNAELAPLHLEVIDESHHHAGHAGAAPGGETHFKVIIKSEQLNELSQVNAHRKIYQILADELKERVHALAIEIR